MSILTAMARFCQILAKFYRVTREKYQLEIHISINIEINNVCHNNAVVDSDSKNFAGN